MRIAILGDSSGWLEQTLTAVRSLGVVVNRHRISWPDDLTVIHVGDLIDKGPNGDDLVAWVDEVMRQVPGRWVQLVGNHEARWLGGPDFSGPSGRYKLHDRTVGTLRQWMASGLARVAVALRDKGGEDWLVTHAGLTPGFWRSLGAPPTAAGASHALERLVRMDPQLVFQAGSMLNRASEPGPVWASPEELEGSWLWEPMLFSQVHGHARSSRLELRETAAVATTPEDEAAHHLRIRVDGHEFVSVDPGFGVRRPRRPMVPFVLEGARLAGALPQ